MVEMAMVVSITASVVIPVLVLNQLRLVTKSLGMLVQGQLLLPVIIHGSLVQPIPEQVVGNQSSLVHSRIRAQQKRSCGVSIAPSYYGAEDLHDRPNQDSKSPQTVYRGHTVNKYR